MPQHIPKWKEISQEITKVIIKLRIGEKSYGETAKTVGICRATVQAYKRNLENTTENKHRSGQPNKLTKREKRNDYQNCNKRLHTTTAVDIANELEKHKLVSVYPRNRSKCFKRQQFS